LVKNDTWDLVSLTKGKYLIGNRWVYKTKYKSDGTIGKYKASLVAKGYAQIEVIDYTEKFSLVAKLDTIMMVLALDAQYRWTIYVVMWMKKFMQRIHKVLKFQVKKIVFTS
jgi:hypothetical protein